MMILKIKICFGIPLLLAFLTACLTTDVPSTDFTSQLNHPQKTIDNQLRMGGCYHHVSLYHIPTDYVNGKPTRYIDTPYVDRPLFFFNNSIILQDETFSQDSATFVACAGAYGHSPTEANSWGVYEIKQDTIKAIIYQMYDDKSRFRPKAMRQCYYQGILKNQDTILQWTMVPPYPKVAEAFSLNDQQLLDARNPRDLYFKSIPAKTLIHPEKAWINKFRK